MAQVLLAALLLSAAAALVGFWVGTAVRVIKGDTIFELRVKVKDTYADIVSPQLPGASSVGQSDTAAIGNFIKTHGSRLGISVVYE